MKKHLSIAVILTFVLAVVSVIASANHNNNIKRGVAAEIKPVISLSATEDEAELKGMWVSYISLDMNGTDYSEKSFREKFYKIASTAEDYKCNALFVHVRPFCDALYNSSIFPSSHVLWGKQGEQASFDAIQIMCEICKEKDIKIHAWINPYRVMAATSEFELSEDNPYKKDKTIGIEYEDGIYLNPAKKDARKLITDGVKEIIENYPVDGIHFDDYFYPTTDESFDKAEYNQYLKSFASERDAMPLSEWRKSNVNMLVAEVYKTIKEHDENIVFGISPQGNINNDLNMGADVISWCKCIGYVDYICPQLYYSLENPALKFEAGLDNWLKLERHEKLKLYAGLAVYKAGSDADEGTWKLSDDILSQELRLIRENDLDGYILYDYEAVTSENSKREMNVFRESLE
ncbi:MAG: family 10 glycosylhydrolase [Ruminococcus sp.]|nr:family 10 glycosylhydrolase [Ruminococcus sp.]